MLLWLIDLGEKRMTEKIWWGYSKRHGWVLLDRSKKENRPGFLTPLIFLRCVDGKEYLEDRKNWDPPNYIWVENYLKSLPPNDFKVKLEEFAGFKKQYSIYGEQGKATPVNIANKFKSLRVNGRMSITLAQQLVEQSAYWHGHPSGRPVSAPSHSSRIYFGSIGWAIDFGANTFLIERAFDRSEKILIEYLYTLGDGSFEKKEAVSRMRRAVRASVSNHIGDIYDSYWSDNGFLVFGTQAIKVDDFINAIFENIGL